MTRYKSSFSIILSSSNVKIKTTTNTTSFKIKIDRDFLKNITYDEIYVKHVSYVIQ